MSCQVARVLSHQSLSRLAVAIATYKIQVSATDSQFIPTIATVVSKPLPINPDIYITQSERIIYYATTLLVVLNQDENIDIQNKCLNMCALYTSIHMRMLSCI